MNLIVIYMVMGYREGKFDMIVCSYSIKAENKFELITIVVLSWFLFTLILGFDYVAEGFPTYFGFVMILALPSGS